MDNLEQSVRSVLFYNLYDSVLDGNEISNEEKEFLLFEIENYIKRNLAENKKAFHTFKSSLSLVSYLIKGLNFGPGYRENYLGIRTRMKQAIEHNNLILNGVKITYNNIDSNNIYTLVKQSNESRIFEDFFSKYVVKIHENLISENPNFECGVGKYYSNHMDKTREKILVLSSQYKK